MHRGGMLDAYWRTTGSKDENGLLGFNVESRHKRIRHWNINRGGHNLNYKRHSCCARCHFREGIDLHSNLSGPMIIRDDDHQLSNQIHFLQLIFISFQFRFCETKMENNSRNTHATYKGNRLSLFRPTTCFHCFYG